jgi:hypothetical protein
MEYIYSVIIYSVSKKAKDAIVIKPCVEKVNIPMELDTGSAVSVISHVDYRKYFLTLSLDSTSVTLKTYSGEKIIPENCMLMFNTIIKGQIWIYMLFEKENRHCLVVSGYIIFN